VALVVEPVEVVEAAVPPVNHDPAEIVAHGLGDIDEIVDGLDVRDVPPVQAVVGAPALVAAVDSRHGEMLQVGILLAMRDLDLGQVVGIGAEGRAVKGTEMVLPVPGGACIAYRLEEFMDMLGRYRREDGAALAAADVASARMRVRGVEIAEVVEGLVPGRQHIPCEGQDLLGQLLPEQDGQCLVESLVGGDVVKGMGQAGLLLPGDGRDDCGECLDLLALLLHALFHVVELLLELLHLGLQLLLLGPLDE